MLTVEKFLCLTLETGGLVISWLTIIGCIFSSIGAFAIIILTCTYSCEEFQRLLAPNDENIDCSLLRGVCIGVSVFILAICIGCVIIAWMCIKGIKNRDHFRVKPMMIFLAIATIASLLQILGFSATGIVRALVNAIINGYFFVVIYSLYDVLRREYETGSNKAHQQPGKV